MKKLNVLLAAALVVAGVFATSCQSRKSASIKSSLDSASYAIGILNGEGFKANYLDNLPGDTVNIDAFIAGFEQALRGDSKNYKITAENAQGVAQTYFENVHKSQLEKTKEEGTKFLEENKAKSGVITTESGLQYQVITEGTGPKPTPEDKVKVHYTGTLLDGSTFDSSVERGEPATFGVTQVIPGWTEGLQIMPVGSKYIFWIPSELGYGEQPPRGSTIKPNSMLKFEVELLEIVKE